MNSQQVLQALFAEVDAGRVKATTVGPLTLFKYSADAVWGRQWNDINRRCRGIVVNTTTGRIVARPFDKFFNLGEHESTDPDVIRSKVANGEPYSATEKLDGTMIAVWHDGHRWRCSTGGALENDHIECAQSLLSNYSFSNMCRDYTYVCELLAPWDRKVVDHGEETRLVFLTAFSNSWDLVEAGYFLGLQMAQSIDIPLVSPISVPRESLWDLPIPDGEEGYVLRFHDGSRLKVKGEWYFRIHKLLDRVSLKNVIQMVRDGSIADAQSDIPEDLRGRLDDLCGQVTVAVERVKESVEKAWERLPLGRDDRTVALAVQEEEKALQPILFARWRGKDDERPLWRAVEKELIQE